MAARTLGSSRMAEFLVPEELRRSAVDEAVPAIWGALRLCMARAMAAEGCETERSFLLALGVSPKRLGHGLLGLRHLSSPLDERPGD